MHDAQQAMLALFYNLPFSIVAKVLRILMFPFGKPFSPPSDKLIHKVARLGLKPSSTRDRLTEGCYRSTDPKDGLGRIEHAFNLAINAKELETTFKKIFKSGDLTSITHAQRIKEAVDKNLISQAEGLQLEELYAATLEAIRVDHFTKEELSRGKK